MVLLRIQVYRKFDVGCMGMKKTQGKKPLRREQRINVASRVSRHVVQILQYELINSGAHSACAIIWLP